MLEEAIGLAKKGESVIVIIPAERHADHMVQLLLTLAHSPGLLVERAFNKCVVRVGSGRITFVSARSDNFLWETRRVAGLPIDSPVLIDHSAIEDRYGKILKEWLRWG